LQRGCQHALAPRHSLFRKKKRPWDARALAQCDGRDNELSESSVPPGSMKGYWRGLSELGEQTITWPVQPRS
jgi:hypothetical protein